MRNSKSDIESFRSYCAATAAMPIHHCRQSLGELVGSWKSKLARSNKHERLLDQFLWHAFSYEMVQCRNGLRAREEYCRQRNRHFYIWTASDGLGLLEFQDQPLPTAQFLEGGWRANPHLADLYVAPANAAWLYALTHERSWDLGPYFVKQEWLGS